MFSKRFKYIQKVSIVIAVCISFSCTRTIILESGQHVLYAQRIISNKKIEREQLEPFFRQKPNNKVLGIPLSLYLYNFGKHSFDTSAIIKKIEETEAKYAQKLELVSYDSTKSQKIILNKNKKIAHLENLKTKGNFWMRVLGSPPVIYDSVFANNTKRQFELFLKSKGYFNSRVLHKVDTLANYIISTYKITENKPYLISQINVVARDGSLKRIFNENLEAMLPQLNTNYDEQILAAERVRIEKLMRNNGYYDFSKKNINFQIDTSNYQVAITIQIENPSDKEKHVKYKVNKIEVLVDQDLKEDSTSESKIFNNINFNLYDKQYKLKVLYRKMHLLKDSSIYSLTNTINTQRNLNQLEMFKFVNINYKKDARSIDGLIATITANSANKYQISDELGFTVSQGIPGPFGSVTFTNRNVFKGCEIFDIGLRGGIEGVASASSSSSNISNVYASTEFGVNANLSFPRIMTLGNFNNYFVNNNPRTRLTVGYNLIFRPEYDRSNTRIASTYNLQKGIYQQFSLSLFDLNYINNQRIDPSFKAYLENLSTIGNNLIFSFRNSINTDIIFSYTYNDFQLGVNKEATFFRLFIEPGGTTLNLLTQNQINDAKKIVNLNAVYSYVKFLVDIRKYLPVSKKSTIATRMSIGISNPYGGDKIMPYEKYFFGGGTNSNRAWLPRRLGPGSYSEKKANGTTDYRYEQPGLILLELNAEYRFKIIKFFDGAVFVDAGNVWNLDGNRKGENFSANFYQEIAVGAGYGFRFDFSFLIVRLDLASKIYDPSQKLGERFVATTKDNFTPYLGDNSRVTWNIAIGYPF